MTTIGTQTARKARIEVSPQRSQIVRTGNGLIRVATGRADTLEVGPIERQDMPVHISGTDAELNVLGMNFLSSLQRWGVEGRWLILEP